MILRRGLLLTLAATALSSCLFDDTSLRRRITETGGDWYLDTGTSVPNQCACPTARPKYIRNGLAYQRPVTLVETANYINDPTRVETEKRDFVVPGYQSKFVRCSVERSESGACDVSYSWALASGTPLSALVASARKSLAAQSLRVSAPQPLSCRAECLASGGPGPRCLLFDNETGPNTPEHGLLAAVRRLGPNGTATRAQLLAAWGKTDADEPCGRGAAVTTNGRFGNSGESCEIGGSFGPGSASTLLLPEQLLGQYQSAADGFSIDFPSANASPSLKLENPYLNAFYGGQVRRIEQASDYFLVSAGNGCLGLKL